MPRWRFDLESAGFIVFLPQREDAERDWPPSDAILSEQRRREMFEFDVAAVIRYDILLVILDGSVPDDGLAFVMGLALASTRIRLPGTRRVGLHDDARAASMKSPLNPKLARAIDEVASGRGVSPSTLGRFEPGV
jgi:nucleoside 2-deoxyribosyltransferase